MSKRMIRTALVTATLLVAPVLSTMPAQADQAPADRAPLAVTEKAGKYKVTIKISKKELVANQGKVKITGRVTPKASGKVIQLQQQVRNRRWKDAGKTKVKANGTYKFVDKPSNEGVRHYRVVVPASKGISKGVSKSVTLTVWKWKRLAWDLYQSASDNVEYMSTAVNAENYGQSLVTKEKGKPGYVEFTLGGKCRKIRFATALTDGSTTGATGQATFSVDGTQQLSTALSIGMTPTFSEFDVWDVSRVRFDLANSADPVGQAAIITPQALCQP